MADKDKVVGKALYLEFRADTQTLQMILTPDGMSNDGRVVPAMMYRRQLSSMRPRRAWKHYSLGNGRASADGVFQSLSLEDAREYGNSRLSMISATIDQLARFKYSVYKSPLVVEVTAEDVETLRKGATPYKIIARITRSRKAAGFEESLFKVVS